MIKYKVKKRMNGEQSELTEDIDNGDAQVQNMYHKAGGMFENQAELAYTTQMFETEMQLLKQQQEAEVRQEEQK